MAGGDKNGCCSPLIDRRCLWSIWSLRPEPLPITSSLTRRGQILERLKLSYPNSSFIADKALAELCLLEEKPADAVQILQSIYATNPRDGALLRLLADAYYLAEDWATLQKLLRDLKHYKAISEQDMASLEQDVYCNLFDQFTACPESLINQRRADLENVWHQMPKRLHRDPEIIAGYGAALGRLKLFDRQQMLLTKTLNKQWRRQLVEQFGELESTSPEKTVDGCREVAAATIAMMLTCC